MHPTATPTPRIRIAAALLAGLLAADSTYGTVIYDSGGFEPARFTAAPTANALTGQDAPPLGQGPWTQTAGTSTAVVQTNSTTGGLPAVQSVRVDRDGTATGDTRFYVPAPVTPTAADGVVRVDVDMDVNIAPVLTSGPLFGVEAYDASASGSPKLIGSLLFDAAQGRVLYAAGGTGIPTPINTFLTRNAYHHYTLAADFAAHTYSIYADDALIHTEPFVDPTAAAFSYAPLATLAAASPTETGTAYFDNYVVSQVASVPEPAAIATAFLAAPALLTRRRKTAR